MNDKTEVLRPPEKRQWRCKSEVRRKLIPQVGRIWH